MAVNVAFLGLPPLLSGALFASTSETPPIPRGELLPGAPVALAALLVPLTWYVLERTRFGLRLRAAGENPEAVASAGLSVTRIRYAAVMPSGALAAAGGAYFGQASQFSRNMTAGRGFIALAALILGRWRPFQTLLACLLFGLAEAVANPDAGSCRRADAARQDDPLRPNPGGAGGVHRPLAAAARTRPARGAAGTRALTALERGACHGSCKCDRVMSSVEDFGPPPLEGFSPTPVDAFSPTPVDGFSPTPINGFGPTPINGFGPTPVDGFGPTPMELLRGAKRIGFVFSGGGFRCAFQIGVVEALDELGIHPCLCAAVSAGAWNAAAVAVGNQRRLRCYWRTFMRMPHLDVTNLLREHSPFIFNEIHRRTFARYVGSDRLRSPLALPLLIGATRLWDRQFVVFDARRVENPFQLMLATNYLPPYYSHPPRLDGEIYVDGCWSNNLPYEAAFDAGCDAVVLMTMKAESAGGIYRNSRDPDHVIPSPYDRRVVVIRPRHRLPLGLIENNWPRMVEIIELGRRRTLEVLSAEHPAIEEHLQVPLGPSRSGSPAIQA